MRANQRSIRDDLAAAGLLPDADHTVAGPSGEPLPSTTSLQHERRKRRLDPVSRDRLFENGWHVVSIKGGDEEGGVTSHRSVLQPGEYVDTGALRTAVEAELGFTYDDVHSVYRQGRLSDSQGELRARIDARLLALSRAGAQVHLLGRLLGLRMRPANSGGDRCEAVSNALARARADELSSTEGSTK